MRLSHRYISALLFVASVGVATPGCAAQIYRPRGGNVSQELQRRAYDNGWSEGVKRGRDDARDGRPVSLDRYKEYRNADKGYRGRDGSKEQYRRAFRQAFQNGYTEAFNDVSRQRGGFGDRSGRRAIPRPGRR
jgi:hypothetical protein